MRVAAHGQQGTADEHGGHHGGDRESGGDVLVVAGSALGFPGATGVIARRGGRRELVDDIASWQRVFGAIALLGAHVGARRAGLLIGRAGAVEINGFVIAKPAPTELLDTAAGVDGVPGRPRIRA